MISNKVSNANPRIKSFGKWGFRFLGPLILAALIVTLKVDLSKMQKLLLATRVEFFLIALFVVAPLSAMARAWRWNMLLNIYGIDYKFWEAFKLFCIGLFVGNFVPQGLGTFSKAIYLKADGYPLDRATASIVADKGFNFAALILIILVSFGYLILSFTTYEQALVLILLVILLCLLLTKLSYRSGNIFKQLLARVFNIIEKWTKVDARWLYRDFRKLRRDEANLLSFVSILALSLDYLIYYLLILALNLNIPFLYFIALSSIVAAVQHIPISFNGIGTRETTMVLVFAILGQTKEAALALSALILLWLLASNLLAGIAWMMRPPRLTPTTS